MSDTEAVETTETTERRDNSPAPALKLFGSDLTKIPCMRTSLLNGYIGAVIGGLAGFFYTSKVRIGCHSALASYWILATGTWFTCRYKLAKEHQFWEKIKQKRMALKTDEYNLPKGMEKLNEKTDSSDNNTPVKAS